MVLSDFGTVHNAVLEHSLRDSYGWLLDTARTAWAESLAIWHRRQSHHRPDCPQESESQNVSHDAIARCEIQGLFFRIAGMMTFLSFGSPSREVLTGKIGERPFRTLR